MDSYQAPSPRDPRLHPQPNIAPNTAFRRRVGGDNDDGGEGDNLAMDALKNLSANIPDWLKRLDDLNGQIEQRQQELAQVTDSSSSTKARSVKNRGSTESLKPRDEPDAHPGQPAQQPVSPTSQPLDTTVATQQQQQPTDQEPPSSPAGSNTPSGLQRQASQAKAAGQARARATLRKRQRTDSVISAEGAAPKYRTRSMIIVYYDSYVQSFFEDLVKFVSASRNMMRKAKMAAKVAQIKRLAELEMPDEDEDEDTGNDGEKQGDGKIAAGEQPAKEVAAASGDAKAGEEKKPAILAADGPLEASPANEGEDDNLPALQYVSTRRMQAVSRQPNLPMASPGRSPYSAMGRSAYGGRGTGGARDVYDELDKGLERVQGMCEHAAHQFLRDGDCAEEVTKIQRWLGETKELATTEMERVKREEPETLKASEDPTKGRSFRPPNMRRDHSAASSSPAGKEKEPGKELGSGVLEVDEAIDDMDQEMPKLVYKSTRMMR